MKKDKFLTRVVNRPTTKGGTRQMIISMLIMITGFILDQIFPDIAGDIQDKILISVEVLAGIWFTTAAANSKPKTKEEAEQFVETEHPDQDRPK